MQALFIGQAYIDITFLADVPPPHRPNPRAAAISIVPTALPAHPPLRPILPIINRPPTDMPNRITPIMADMATQFPLASGSGLGLAAGSTTMAAFMAAISAMAAVSAMPAAFRVAAVKVAAVKVVEQLAGEAVMVAAVMASINDVTYGSAG